MIEGRTVLALIPARGGSKRLPGKNLKMLCGRPMIHWTIGEAKKSKYIDKIAVSTEDPAIVAAVSNLGVQIVDRPRELAEDTSNVYDAIFHALGFFEPHDYIVLLQATSPLRIAEDIDGCIETCYFNHAPSCISIDRKRPVANGAVYVAWTTWLREMRQFDSGRAVTYLMPTERSVDVDRWEDFREAERLLSLREFGSSSGSPTSSILPFSKGEKKNTSNDASKWLR